MKKLKGDNRGLSLIEVLVAVTILAIVVIPFLHSFVTAATTNSKAKKIHKATVVAQSVMEGFKAEELEALALQFDYPEQGFYVVPTGRINGGTSLRNSLNELVVGEFKYDSSSGAYTAPVKYEDPALDGVVDKKAGVTASTYSEDMGVTSEFLGQTDGVYYFYLDSVKEDISEYDVLVKADASTYRSGAVGGTPTYNDEALAQLPIIDLEQDAMCIQKETYTDAAVEYFQTTFASLNEDTIRNGMGRTITISIDRTLVGTEYKTMVTAEYKYSYQQLGHTKEYPKNQTCYDSYETGNDLRSVYLYYYPLYTTIDGAYRDEIVFKNDSQLPVNFYLIKQTSASATTNNEEYYELELRLLENGSSLASKKTNVYTNLATNLANGSDISVPDYKVYWNESRYWNGSTVGLSDIAPQGVLATEKLDRMFDIEVSVYEKGARSANYPEDMRLTTLEGSKIN